jgi:hypothetical protein
MVTRWEIVISLAREVDDDCASGRKLDVTRVARLARAVLDFQQSLVAGLGGGRPSASAPPPSAAIAPEPAPQT